MNILNGYFRNISSIIDVRLGYYIETFEVKLRWSKSSRLLQRLEFLVKVSVGAPDEQIV